MVIPLVANQQVTANELESTTLYFAIENAIPPVMPTNIHWFYSAESAPFLFAAGYKFEDITSQTSCKGISILTLSGDRLNLTIVNIVQAKTEGDAGRYFFEATNEAGMNSSYIDLIVFGKFLRYIIYIYIHILCLYAACLFHVSAMFALPVSMCVQLAFIIATVIDKACSLKLLL